jgi:hypothetical protein
MSLLVSCGQFCDDRLPTGRKEPVQRAVNVLLLQTTQLHPHRASSRRPLCLLWRAQDDLNSPDHENSTGPVPVGFTESCTLKQVPEYKFEYNLD